MDSKPEDFKKLLQLLRLKRHEQPPPGYFDHFATDVIVRLRYGESRGDAVDAMDWQAPWLQRFLAKLTGNPLWSGAVGAAACALLLTTLISAQHLDFKPLETNEYVQTPPVAPVERANLVFSQPLATAEGAALTNASVQPSVPGGLFDAHIQPVNVGSPAYPWSPR